MAQHDMNIANQGFPATRADLNNALQAIATNNSGTSAPSTTFANQWWYDTTNNILYIRNEANNAWISIAVLDQTNNQWQITTGQITAHGSGLSFKTDDGNTRITLADGGDVTFADGTDIITASAGTQNTRLGAGAADAIQSGGNYNVAIGGNAMGATTTGNQNTACGFEALRENTTGVNNAAFGLYALLQNTTGGYNTAVGLSALQNATTANNNVAVGNQALDTQTTATENVAVGQIAGNANTTGSSNTFIGRAAGHNNTTAGSNTIVGHEAGYSNTTSQYNCLIGRQAGYYQTGGANTFIGQQAGVSVTTGGQNTILGRFSGNQNGVDIRTDSDNIILSDGNGNATARCNSGNWIFRPSASSTSSNLSSEALGVDALGVTRNGFASRVDNNSYFNFMGQNPSNTNTFRVYGSGDVQNSNNSYGAISDQKVKENISDAGSQWDDIKAIRVRKYSLIMDELDTANQIGVIAQELEASGMGGLVQTDADRDEDMNDLGTVTKSVKYSVLYMKAIKALQEAIDRIETLEAKVTALENA